MLNLSPVKIYLVFIEKAGRQRYRLCERLKNAKEGKSALPFNFCTNLSFLLILDLVPVKYIG